MGRKKGHASGGKVTSKHSTVIPAAEKLVAFVRKDKRVNRVALGLIKQVGNGSARISYEQINGGLEVTVRGARTQQVIRLYTGAFRAVRSDLKRKFGG
jgi:hypothetical protein